MKCLIRGENGIRDHSRYVRHFCFVAVNISRLWQKNIFLILIPHDRKRPKVLRNSTFFILVFVILADRTFLCSFLPVTVPRLGLFRFSSGASPPPPPPLAPSRKETEFYSVPDAWNRLKYLDIWVPQHMGNAAQIFNPPNLCRVLKRTSPDRLAAVVKIVRVVHIPPLLRLCWKSPPLNHWCVLKHRLNQHTITTLMTMRQRLQKEIEVRAHAE